ncbi:MAG: phosphatidate cytidylyltransferase [Solirubrobacterales bacterium]
MEETKVVRVVEKTEKAPRGPRFGRRPKGRELRSRSSDLLARVLVALPLIVLAVVLVAAGGWVFAAGLLVLGIMALRELFSMFPRWAVPVFAVFLAFAVMIVLAHTGGPPQLLLAMVIALPVVFLGGLIAPRRGDVRGLALAMLGLAWIGLALSHAVMLRDLEHGAAILVLVLVATFVGDTGAYFGGRAFGRRKLAPSLSPGKTWEGLLIGILAGTIAGWFVGLYLDWLTGLQALLLGFCAALIAPLGDLFESALKREAHTKDSGTVFGAHGGVLDRLDAALFAVVVGFYVWQAML